jgi:hypothetical protein
MEAARSSKTLVKLFKITWGRAQENNNHFNDSRKNLGSRMLVTYFNIISGQPLVKQKQFPKNHISFFLVEFPSNFPLNSHVKILLGSLSSRSTLLETEHVSNSSFDCPTLCIRHQCGVFITLWHKAGFTITLLTVVLHYNAESILLFILILGATRRI